MLQVPRKRSEAIIIMRQCANGKIDSFPQTDSVDKGFLQMDGERLLNPVGLLEVELGGGVGIAEGNLE